MPGTWAWAEEAGRINWLSDQDFTKDLTQSKGCVFSYSLLSPVTFFLIVSLILLVTNEENIVFAFLFICIYPKENVLFVKFNPKYKTFSNVHNFPAIG